VEIRLVLHLTSIGNGGYTATLDSPDQGAKGIPVNTVLLERSTLKFEVPRVGASYSGKVDAAATTITGIWSVMGGSVPLNLSRPPAPVKRVPKPSDIDGDWEGALNGGGAVLRVVMHIVTFEDGMTVTLDSPDQNALGMPATSVTRDGTKVRFELKQIAGGFSGTLDTALTTIEGTWTQLNNSLPLVLKRVRR
jgi:hypothetical protein